MASTFVPDVELCTEVVQIIRGGEPDSDGISLAGRTSPLRPSYNASACACACMPIAYSLWEALEHLSPYADNSDIWIRTLPESEEGDPLPEGAEVIETRRVSYLVR
jgi:hypothetical protein